MTDAICIRAVRPSRPPRRGLLRMTVFWMPSKPFVMLRSAEGASRSTHGHYATRRLMPLLILLLIALAVAGCGKKGNPQPPPGEPDTYPRTYPSE